MTTVNSNDLQLKLIGKGLEAGTWDQSTNENWKRVEASLGKSVAIDLYSMPLNSVSATGTTPTAARWVTVASSDTGEIGSEGRSRVVELRSTGSPTSALTLRICGNTVTADVNRVYFFKNSCTQPVIITDATGSASTVTIPVNGFGLVVSVANAVGSLSKGVHNLLSNITLAGLESTGNVSFILPDAQAEAFKIEDGSVTYLSINTTNDRLEIKNSPIYLADQATDINITDNNSGSLRITEGANVYLSFDTTDSSEKIIIGPGGAIPATLDIQTENIDISNQDVLFTVGDASTTSFRVSDGVVDYLDIDTVENIFNVKSHVVLSKSDQYLNFGSSWGASTPGLRANTGVIELKEDATASWNKLMTPFVSTAIGASTDDWFESQSGTIDIGPMRLHFDTFTTGGGTFTLDFTGIMSTRIWSVISGTAQTNNVDSNLNAYLSGLNEVTIVSFFPQTQHFTLWLIGDSGA